MPCFSNFPITRIPVKQNYDNAILVEMRPNTTRCLSVTCLMRQMLSWECKRCLKKHCLLNEFIRDWCYLYITDYQHIPNSYVSWVFIWEMSKHPVLYVATLSVAKQRPGRALLHPPVPGFNLVSGPLTQFTAAVLIKNVQHKCVTFSWLLTWTKHRRWLPLFWQWNEMVIFLFKKKKKKPIISPACCQVCLCECADVAGFVLPNSSL